MADDETNQEDPREAWERQPDETSEQFEAFRVFRDLGPGRTVREAYAEYPGSQDDFDRVPGYFYEWSSHNNWQERARAWDDEVDRIHRGRIKEQVRETRETIASHMQKLVSMLIDEIAEKDEMAREDKRTIIKLAKILGVSSPEEIEVEHKGEAVTFSTWAEAVAEELGRQDGE